MHDHGREFYHIMLSCLLVIRSFAQRFNNVDLLTESPETNPIDLTASENPDEPRPENRAREDIALTSETNLIDRTADESPHQPWGLWLLLGHDD
jgi:hypothetical protein